MAGSRAPVRHASERAINFSPLNCFLNILNFLHFFIDFFSFIDSNWKNDYDIWCLGCRTSQYVVVFCNYT